MELTQIQAPSAMRLVSPDGVHCMQLTAGEVREVNAVMLLVALSKGCLVIDDNPIMEAPLPNPEAAPLDVDVTADDGIPAILDAIKLLFQLGDASKLTVNGDPKIRAIEELLGFTISRLERDKALALYREEAED